MNAVLQVFPTTVEGLIESIVDQHSGNAHICTFKRLCVLYCSIKIHTVTHICRRRIIRIFLSAGNHIRCGACAYKNNKAMYGKR